MYTRTPNFQVLDLRYEFELSSERLSTKGGGGWGHLIPQEVSDRLRMASSLALRLEAIATLPYRLRVSDNAKKTAIAMGRRHGCEAIVSAYLEGLDSPTGEPHEGWRRIREAWTLTEGFADRRGAVRVSEALENAQKAYWDYRSARTWGDPLSDPDRKAEAAAEVKACLELPMAPIAEAYAAVRKTPAEV